MMEGDLQSTADRYGWSSWGHTIASVAPTASPFPSPPSFLIQQMDNAGAFTIPPELKYFMTGAKQVGIIPVAKRALRKELCIFS